MHFVCILKSDRCCCNRFFRLFKELFFKCQTFCNLRYVFLEFIFVSHFPNHQCF
ncbi:conserved protein of unknown function [Listeria monocytogenes]|nr:conserved protein of unknown function [Listeria monocytogenes]